MGSVTDREIVSFAAQGADWIYHLAAAQHEMNISDQKFWQVNVEGTRNVLEASTRAGAKRFVHGSTIGVYGRISGEIDENSITRPDNIYGVTKLEAEKLVLSFREKVPVVIIRIAETYGPGDYRLLKLFKAIQKGLFFMVGDGSNRHHPVYIDDLIEGLRLAATVNQAIGKIFVLPGKAAVTTRDLVAIVARQLNKKPPHLRLPLAPLLAVATAMEAALRPLGIQPPLHRRRMDFFKKSFVFSGQQSEKILGFIPKVSFEQGVAETVRWYRQMGYL
jgi:nucleoside-diphosphate-sugar epimerase